jgi:hypothetical protein
MSSNWGPVEERYKSLIDALAIDNTNKTNFKRRINSTFNENVMQKVFNEAKALANAKRRVNNMNLSKEQKNNYNKQLNEGKNIQVVLRNAQTAANRRTEAAMNNLTTRMGNINLSTSISERIIKRAQSAGRETLKLLNSGKTADAIVSCLVLLSGVLAMSQYETIDANRILNVFPRGLPHMEPWLSATYTSEKWAKRAVFWFAQFKTKQFSPLYTTYEEAFATFGKNRKSKAGVFMTSLFIYSYYAFIVTSMGATMPSLPENVRKFFKGTLVGLYQKASHRYTLSVVTPIIFTLMYQVYVEKLKLEASTAYKIYELLVGRIVEDRAMQALATGGTLVAKKALPYLTKLKVRQLAPPQYQQAVEIAIDTIANVAAQGPQIAEMSPGGRLYPLTPRGGGGAPPRSPRSSRTRRQIQAINRMRATTPNVGRLFETPSPEGSPARPRRR